MDSSDILSILIVGMVAIGLAALGVALWRPRNLWIFWGVVMALKVLTFLVIVAALALGPKQDSALGVAALFAGLTLLFTIFSVGVSLRARAFRGSENILAELKPDR